MKNYDMRSPSPTVRRSYAAQVVAACALLLLLAGCAGKHRLPDLAGIYSRAARHHDETRNPVILIPGVLGSRLVDSESDRLVWGAFAGGYAHPGKPDGAIAVLEKGPGDGTVLRSSALMDERPGAAWRPELVSPIRWTQVFFVFTEHMEMTKDPAFTDNLLYLLLEHPR